MVVNTCFVSVLDSVYEQLKEDVLGFKLKGRVVLLGHFNERVGKSAAVDDAMGMFGEDTCNRNGILTIMNTWFAKP